MVDRAPSVTRWAILVGVGVSIDRREAHNPIDRSLRGAAADVIAMEAFLKASFPGIDITCLTASKPGSDSASDSPQESQERLATRKNVTSAFERVIQAARSGDHVYFHFSGHGVRRDQDGAVALAVYSRNTTGTMYVLGHYLRDYFHRMQEKQLLVTLVLDCCFSGSVSRNGNLHGIRSLQYDNQIAALSEEEHIADANFAGRFRDASLRLDQLLRNENHVIIAACGPEEYASEITVGGESRGALSYMLLDALNSLKRAGAQVSLTSLYQSLRARFHVSQQSQTPLLFGTQRESFFAEIETPDNAMNLVSVYRHQDTGSLLLDAGQAHGINEGDEFVAYPFASDESKTALASHGSVKLKAVTVGALTSCLQAADAQAGGVGVINVNSTWKAQLVSCFTNRRTWIRLPRDIPNHDRLLAQAEHHLYLGLSDDEFEQRAYNFQVRATDDLPSTFVVEDLLSKRVPNVPDVAIDTRGSVDHLLRLMGHLATFKYFEALENRIPDPQFEKSFSLTCDSSLDKSGFYNMSQGESLYLDFKNNDMTEPKHVTIFIFKSHWGIDNLGNGNWLSVPPMSSSRLKLDMDLSKHTHEAGGNEDEDILKVFVTNQLASFPAVILRSIHDVVRDDMEGPERLLNGLRGITRDGSSKWATRTFLSRTHRK